MVDKKKQINDLAVRDGAVAITAGRNLTVWPAPNADPIKYKYKRGLHGVCFHPSEDYLCASDSFGCVVLWFRYANVR
jgi:hypothetical protein